MYIVCSYNVKNSEICSRNIYKYRDDAIKNLVDEAIQYVAINKRESCVFGSIDHQKQGWYVCKTDKDEEVALYRVTSTPVKGWIVNYETFSTEKVMVFSIIVVPEEKDTPLVVETPKISVPVVRNSSLQSELHAAVLLRREKFIDLQ